MDKQEYLNQLSAMVQQNVVSRKEVLDAIERGAGNSVENSEVSHVTVAEVMYYVGGAIVFMGIAVLLWQRWDTLSGLTQIIASLGSSVAAYLLAVVFIRDSDFEKLAQAMFFLSAILMPLGLAVLLDKMHVELSVRATGVVISGALFGVYLSSFGAYRRIVLLLFSILFATWLYFALTGYLANANPALVGWKFYAYRTLVAGVAYVFLGYYFERSEYRGLASFLNAFGIFSILAAALILGGWKPSQSMIWEGLFPAFALGAMFASIPLHSKSFLVCGSIFLMIYFVKITSEYFSNSLGWPFALVIAGLFIIAVGYASFVLNRKYFKANPQ
jgi:hypothetical protein